MTILTENELKKYGKTYSLSKRAIALVNHQKANWPLAATNYPSLKLARTRTLSFGHFRIDCQFNPERIRSSAANTDASAIEARPCFLCETNRPEEQSGIPFGEDYVILCNPFPIFPYHLTIPLNRHEPQQITGHIGEFLRLTSELQEFVVFYNGPKCGASAPDHFHFQAGIRDVLPVEDELAGLLQENSTELVSTPHGTIYSIENYLRRMVCFSSSNIELLEHWINTAISVLHASAPGEEPMLNLLAWYSAGNWQVILFPRAAQRPREYYADDFDRLLVSPAAVELGGLIILPREEDFFRIREEDLISIFSQVTLQEKDFGLFKNNLIQAL
jgi:hypothetical protein